MGHPECQTSPPAADFKHETDGSKPGIVKTGSAAREAELSPGNVTANFQKWKFAQRRLPATVFFLLARRTNQYRGPSVGFVGGIWAECLPAKAMNALDRR